MNSGIKLIYLAGGAIMQWVISTKEGKNFANKTVDRTYKIIKDNISNMSKTSDTQKENKEKESGGLNVIKQEIQKFN